MLNKSRLALSEGFRVSPYKAKHATTGGAVAVILFRGAFCLLLDSSYILGGRCGWKSVEFSDLDLLRMFGVRLFDHL